MREVIGIAGTAKNTGKTTTLQAVAAFLRARRVPLFLTSIGYDGEDLDNVTGLPKPKVTVEEGDQVATALPLLERSAARFSGFVDTGVKCALGPVYYATATHPGRVVVAGPASTQEVSEILDVAPAERTVLLDGALSRLAPLSLATSLIIATGAARSEDPRFLSKELRGISAVMSLPRWSPSRTTGVKVPGGLYAAGSEAFIPGLLRTQYGRLDSRPPKGRVRVDVEGPVNPQILLSLVSALEDVPVKASFVANHPVDLLLSGDPTAWPAVMSEVVSTGHALSVRRPARLLGFTINPYLPRFDRERGYYRADQVPARPFLDAVRAGVEAPCTDIVLEGRGLLEEWLSTLTFAPVSANV
jgi:hypothetical protein